MNSLACQDVICSQFEFYPKESGREPEMNFIKITRFKLNKNEKKKPKKTKKNNKSNKTQ